MQKNHFLLLKKLKDTESAQLCDFPSSRFKLQSRGLNLWSKTQIIDRKEEGINREGFWMPLNSPKFIAKFGQCDGPLIR